jgi:hypothetical protein
LSPTPSEEDQLDDETIEVDATSDEAEEEDEDGVEPDVVVDSPPTRITRSRKANPTGRAKATAKGKKPKGKTPSSKEEAKDVKPKVADRTSSSLYSHFVPSHSGLSFLAPIDGLTKAELAIIRQVFPDVVNIFVLLSCETSLTYLLASYSLHRLRRRN